MVGETDFVWEDVNAHDAQEYGQWAALTLRGAFGVAKTQGYDDETARRHSTFMVASLMNQWAWEHIERNPSNDWLGSSPVTDAIHLVAAAAYALRANL